MPFLIIGGYRTSVPWVEYFAAILPAGTPVEWLAIDGVKTMFSTPADESGTGIVKYSWSYDGINLCVDICGKSHSLMLGCRKYRLRRLRDISRLAAPGVNGEGI